MWFCLQFASILIQIRFDRPYNLSDLLQDGRLYWKSGLWSSVNAVLLLRSGIHLVMLKVNDL
jgi:hypothetical protein